MSKTQFQKKLSASAVGQKALVDYLAKAMSVPSFKDYCPNGLQVEGKAQISRLAVAVSASLNAIEAARDWGADALLVHHGLFWKSDSPVIVGTMKRRVSALLKAEMSLLAYHLPLDVHPDWGNNRALGDALGFVKPQPVSSSGLIWATNSRRVLTAQQLTRTIEVRLGRAALAVGALDRSIRRVAWCTGGAQGYLGEAIELGADVFISGEISEQTTHLAREAGVVFIAAGHHATERYGVQALGKHLQKKFQLEVKFFDDDNPA